MTNRPYQRIILHAGLHKTGTTSIQDNCFRHRDWLSNHGICYPVFSLKGRRFSNHSDPITASICKPPRMYGTDKRICGEGELSEAIGVLSEQLQHILEYPDKPTLLLSAELVCSYEDEDILALRRYLEEFTDELQVIAFVRSPQSSLESILQQRSLTGKLIELNPGDRIVVLFGANHRKLLIELLGRIPGVEIVDAGGFLED